jgi:hypothetical protein
MAVSGPGQIGPRAGAAGYPDIVASELQQAHYDAAYAIEKGEDEPLNAKLRALGEKLVD